MGAKYCTPHATNSLKYINEFSTTGGIINISNLDSGFSTGGYGNFTEDHLLSQFPGTSVNFLAKTLGGTAGLRIWIDWNQDGIFSPDEVAYASRLYESSHDGIIDIPETCSTGSDQNENS